MKRLKKALEEFLQPEYDPERLIESARPLTGKLTKLREDFALSRHLKHAQIKPGQDVKQLMQDELNQMSVHVDDLEK